MNSNSCELELSLRLGGACSCCASSACRSSEIQRQQQRQQITIFYGSRIFVCNVTDDQAKAIICSAKTDMEEQQKLKELLPCRSPPSSRSPVAQPVNPELSMKRSLHQFLQKRKARIDATSP